MTRFNNGSGPRLIRGSGMTSLYQWQCHSATLHHHREAEVKECGDFPDLVLPVVLERDSNVGSELIGSSYFKNQNGIDGNDSMIPLMTYTYT